MNLSVILITNRYEPHVEWTLDSLLPQFHKGERPEIIVVAPPYVKRPSINPPCVRWIEPKPCIWSGPHRITKTDWWSICNSRNTGICLAKNEWLAFIDDRSVFLPGWVDCVREAMAGEYVVAGTYQKVTDMVVENGKVVRSKPCEGRDARLDYVEKYWMPPPHSMRPPFKAPGEWTYGCSTVVPLEWALRVGGYDETCDGSGGEDYIFGLMLQNHGFPIYYDPRMVMVEDRTPGQTGPVSVRKDKGVSPNDKSHKLLETLRVLKHAKLPADLRGIRAMVQAGKGFPAPTSPHFDWYDNQPIKDFE